MIVHLKSFFTWIALRAERLGLSHWRELLFRSDLRCDNSSENRNNKRSLETTISTVPSRQNDQVWDRDRIENSFSWPSSLRRIIYPTNRPWRSPTGIQFSPDSTIAEQRERFVIFSHRFDRCRDRDRLGWWKSSSICQWNWRWYSRISTTLFSIRFRSTIYPQLLSLDDRYCFLLSNPNCSPLRILSQLFLNRQIIPTVRNRSLFPLSADVSPWCSPLEHHTKISFFEPSERIANFDWQDKKNDLDVTFLSDLSRRHPMRALRTIFIDEFDRAERRIEAMGRKRREEIQAISILFISSSRWHLKSWEDEMRIRSTSLYRSRNGEPKSETRYKERIESVEMISIGDKWSFVSICWGWRRESNEIVLVNLSAAIRSCRGEMRSARCRQRDERFLLLVSFSRSMNESLF